MARSRLKVDTKPVTLISRISVENFRCFSVKQDVPIAPLTFLVGENSTGKTSFLGISQVLWDMAIRQHPPVFNKPPFDLGGFDEIVCKGSSQKSPLVLKAGFEMSELYLDTDQEEPTKLTKSNKSKVWRFNSSFKKHGEVPVLSSMSVAEGDRMIEERFKGNFLQQVRLLDGKDKYSLDDIDGWRQLPLIMGDMLVAPDYFLMLLRHANGSDEEIEQEVLDGFGEFVSGCPFSKFTQSAFERELYATSPVRSKPDRTYHATNFMQDPEGRFVPFFLANIHSQNPDSWTSIQEQMEQFGRKTGLFNSLTIKRSTELEGAPFQIHVDLPDTEDSKESSRSLVDVGYGVSQSLPLMVSLLSEESSPLTLMQQPEVHLHPRAQAALGDLFCGFVENEGRQLLVETHSDYLIERVRIRIKERMLDPNFVVVLFFERNGSGVSIHPIRFDEFGNVLDAPQSYRSFFLEEMDRSLGLN